MCVFRRGQIPWQQLFFFQDRDALFPALQRDDMDVYGRRSVCGGHVDGMFEFGPGGIGDSDDGQFFVDRMNHVVADNTPQNCRRK